MSFFSRLPGDAGVRHAMALNKPAGRALVQLHTDIMRQPSQFSAGERELIAADAQAVFAVGWDEQALHDAIGVVCLFNFMNRFADGDGIKGDIGVFAARGKALKEGGYDPLLETLAD